MRGGGLCRLGGTAGAVAGAGALIFLRFTPEIFACVAPVAGRAFVGRLTEADLRPEFFALTVGADRVDAVLWQDVRLAVDVLRGDLEAVEEQAGAARVEMGGAEGVEDLGEGELDGAAVFQYGEKEGLTCGDALPQALLVKPGVEVAIRLVFQGVRTALASVGHDVAAFQVHRGPSPLPIL